LSAGFYHGLLPPRFAAQGYCWWNSRLLESFVALWSNSLCDFTSHLPSGDRFDMLRIDYQQFKPAFQQVEYRFPIHPGCLEGDMGASLFFEPIAEL
jgi:hypothetical protein